MKPGQTMCRCGKAYFPKQKWAHENCDLFSPPSRVTPDESVAPVGAVEEVDQPAPRAKTRAGAQASPVKHSLKHEESVKHRMADLGKRGGLVGGVVRAARLSPQRRVEIARAAALARWGK